MPDTVGSLYGALVALLTDDQIRQFSRSGYLVTPGLVDAADLDLAGTEVDRLWAATPPPEGHTGHHFYWRSAGESPALLGSGGPPGRILPAAGELTTPGPLLVAFDQVQVALNIPPYPHRPSRPHIDGYQPGQRTPGTFTLLAGLLLSDQETPDGGNLWVWPGTHQRHAAFFAAHGPEAFATAAGYLDIDLPAPAQVLGRRGDVLLAHYLLGHNIGGNHAGNRTRRMLYWRLAAEGQHGRRAECLTDEWRE